MQCLLFLVKIYMQPMFGYGVAKVLDFGHLEFEVTSMKKKKNG